PLADFHHASLIEFVGVREDRLRRRLLQRLFQFGKEDTPRQAVSFCKLFRELVIGFGDSHDLQVRPVLKLIKKPERMAMDKACKSDAQPRVFRLHLRLCLRAQISPCASQQSHEHQEKVRTIISSHVSPSNSCLTPSRNGCQASARCTQTNQKIDRTCEKQRRRTKARRRTREVNG